MLNALDLSINDGNEGTSQVKDESQKMTTEVTIDTHNIELSQNIATDQLTTVDLIAEGEHHAEDSLWIKANTMMGDLEGLGLKLKSEVESTLKHVASQQQLEGKKLAAMSRSMEDYQTEINSLKLNISALQAASDETREDLQNQLINKDKQNKEVASVLENKMLALNSQIASLETQNDQLKMELQTNKESLDSRQDNAVDKEEIDKLNAQLQEKESDITELNLEVSKVNHVLEEKETLIIQLEDEKATLSSALLEKDSEISDLNDKLQATEEHYEGKVALLEKQLEETNSTLHQETQEKEYYTKQLETVLAEFESLKEKYKAKKKENKDLEQSLEMAKKATGAQVSQTQLRYYQEMERKYVQAKKYSKSYLETLEKL